MAKQEEVAPLYFSSLFKFTKTDLMFDPDIPKIMFGFVSFLIQEVICSRHYLREDLHKTGAH